MNIERCTPNTYLRIHNIRNVPTLLDSLLVNLAVRFIALVVIGARRMTSHRVTTRCFQALLRSRGESSGAGAHGIARRDFFPGEAALLCLICAKTVKQ